MGLADLVTISITAPRSHLCQRDAAWPVCLHDVLDAFESVDLRKFALPMGLARAKVEEPSPGVFVILLLIRLRVHDREAPYDYKSREQILLDFTTGTLHLDTRDAWARQSAIERSLEWLRQELRTAVLHELDECIEVHGARLWDPHVDRRDLPIQGMLVLEPKIE